MKIYRNILEHHIRNKELLVLIEKYNRDYTDIRCSLSDKIVLGGSWDLSMFKNLIQSLFNSYKTPEGYSFWENFYTNIPFISKNFFIDEWKHADEWLTEENLPSIIKTNKDLHIETLQRYLAVQREHLYFFSLRSIAHTILSYYMFSLPAIHMPDPKELALFTFYDNHNRFPNDFDS